MPDFALPGLALVATPPLLAALLVAAWVDHRQKRLPDLVTLPLVLSGLLVQAAAGGLPDAAIGALAGYAVFWAIGEAFFRWRATEGLGQGDAKLLAAAGAWLGWQALPWLVLMASMGALALALVQARMRGEPAGRVQIAFGPWLAAAFGILWVLEVLRATA